MTVNSTQSAAVADEMNGLKILPQGDFRGPIYGADDESIFKGFPVSVELVADEDISVDGDLSAYDIFRCAEGTVIRVFERSGTWYTATTRRLDAFKSRWASKTTSFGETFTAQLRRIDALDDDPKDDRKFLERFYERRLSPGERYAFFLVSRGDERIVCDEPGADEPGVLFLGVERPDSSFDFDRALSLDDDKTFPKPERLKFDSVDEVKRFVRVAIDYRHHQGVIMFRGALESIKILSPEYAERFALRDNVASLKYRYLQLRGDSDLLAAFLDLYPSMIDEASRIERDVYEGVCKSLHALYMRRYIENRIGSECSKEETFALRLIHKQYAITRQRTTPSRINDILTTEAPATIVNKLLRAYRRKMSKIAREED